MQQECYGSAACQPKRGASMNPSQALSQDRANRVGSTRSGPGAVARGQRKGEPDHNQSLDSHAGHGRDLAELVPIQPVKFIHLEQAVFHEAGEDEQKSCKTEIEATFYFVALNA